MGPSTRKQLGIPASGSQVQEAPRTDGPAPAMQLLLVLPQGCGSCRSGAGIICGSARRAATGNCSSLHPAWHRGGLMSPCSVLFQILLPGNVFRSDRPPVLGGNSALHGCRSAVPRAHLLSCLQVQGLGHLQVASEVAGLLMSRHRCFKWAQSFIKD